MKKKIKKILLAGFGAEIGSMLVSMNNPKKDGLLIDTVITKPIPTEKNHTHCFAIPNHRKLYFNCETVI